MTPDEKAHAIREFFLAPEPRRALTPLLIGAVLLAIGLTLASESPSSGFGLLVSGVGLAWAVFLPISTKRVGDRPENEMQYFSVALFSSAKARYEARPSLAQMVTWLHEGLECLDDLSASSLGLAEGDTTQEPLKIVGPRYDSEIEGFADEDVLRRKVADDRYFYSTFRVALFQFTDRFLGSYQADYNLIKDTCTSEQTDEFFYRDVVAVRVSSESSNFTLKSGQKLEHAKTFSLGLTSGDHVTVVLDGAGLGTAAELGSIGEGAVANVRAMLRQYKELQATA